MSDKWNAVMKRLEVLYEHYYEEGAVDSAGITDECLDGIHGDLRDLMEAYDEWLD